MKQALKLAEEAYEIGEVPVGCVFVYDDKAIATGRNNTNASKNGTRHAEIEAIDSILRTNKYPISIIEKCTLYVTVEPCMMCTSALNILKIKKVYFGCKNDKFGGCGSVFPENQFEIESGLLENEAIMMLRRFYVTENEHAPNPRKKANRVLKDIA